MTEAASSSKKTGGNSSKNKFKVVVLGDVMVGKTSFISRFLYGSFNSSYQPTIGIDFLSTTITFPERSVRLQIWDTAGQERFRSLIPSYIRDCAIAFVLYDISDRTSFENVKEWISRIRNEGGENAIIMLCGNKLDLVELNQRKVMTEEGEALAKDLNLLFGEVSAKTGENVKTVFHTAAAQLPSPESNAPQLENIEKGALPKPVNLEASGPKPGELGCAC